MTRPGVGVGVIIKKEGKVLLQLRKGAHGEGTWSFPGGHMEYGETPEQTAEREAKEETNVQIKSAKLVGVTNDIMHSEKKHYVTFFVEAEYAGGEVKINDSSVSEIKWFSLNELPQPLFLPVKNFFENRRLL